MNKGKSHSKRASSLGRELKQARALPARKRLLTA
jgi:hypothetical protein